MQHSTSNFVVKVDTKKIRIDIAARLIAYHCTQGKKDFWIKPLFDSPLFDYYFSTADHAISKVKELASWAIELWPEDKIDDIKLFPLLQLLRRHSVEEQGKILEILEKQYGLHRNREQ